MDERFLGGGSARAAARSANDLRIGTATGASGRVRRGRLWTSGYPPELMPPVVIVGGAAPGPVAAVVAGVHGDEASAIQAVRSLADALAPERLAGSVVLVPVANVAAFRDRRPLVHPLDGRDLDQAFPGMARGGPSARLAHALVDQLVAAADAVLEVQSGGLVLDRAAVAVVDSGDVGRREGTSPTEGEQARAERERELAEALGLDAVVAAPLAGSLVRAARTAGRVALRAQAGGGARPASDSVDRLVGSAGAFLERLGLLAPGDGPPRRPAPAPPRRYAGWTWLMSPNDGYWQADVRAGDDVDAGQRLGRVWAIDSEPAAPPSAVVAPHRGRVIAVASALAATTAGRLVAVARAN